MKIEFEIPEHLVREVERIAESTNRSRDEIIRQLIEEKGMTQKTLRLTSFQQESTDRTPKKFKKVGIIGCNAFSRGIAKLMAIKGVYITVFGRSKAMLDEFHQLMQRNLDWMLSKWELTETEKKLIFQQIMTTTSLDDLKDTDLVIDTQRCSRESRIKIHCRLEDIINSDVMIAIDDDTCLIRQLKDYVKHPERMIGFHISYPASRRKIVEIMIGQATSTEIYHQAIDLANFLNKQTVMVEESPGAVSTRAILTMINETLHILSEGTAAAEDIDKTIKLAMNLSIGPFEYADTLGLDVVLEIMESLWQSYHQPQFYPDALLKRLVRSGFLGKKTGRGILIYDSKSIGEVP